jgi:hypothetical protein
MAMAADALTGSATPHLINKGMDKRAGQLHRNPTEAPRHQEPQMTFPQQPGNPQATCVEMVRRGPEEKSFLWKLWKPSTTNGYEGKPGGLCGLSGNGMSIPQKLLYLK